MTIDTAAAISNHFDCVIFLTSSNWFTEPRSNRYHYATRFARYLPVTFVQFDSDTGEAYSEPADVDNISVLHLSPAAAPGSVTYRIDPIILEKAVVDIRTRCAGRPLVWVYNPYAADLARELNPRLCVYHATEIYIHSGDNIYSKDKKFLDYLNYCVNKLVDYADITFAVSDGVRESLLEAGANSAKIIENYNGVDAEFWLELNAIEHVPQQSGRPAVLYQGGVNDRLNFELIYDVVKAMPDWDFWFCGAQATKSQSWRNTVMQSNVKVFGALPLPEVAALAKKATVGWAPFRKSHQLFASMPLKMYEYVACGLPVVSTPIRGLLGADVSIFRFAEDSAGTAASIEAAKGSRTDAEALEMRRALASANSYDRRFDYACGQIVEHLEAKSCRKSILIFYDDKFSHLPAIDWHLRSFSKYSRHQVFYAPGSIVDGMTGYNNLFNSDTAEDINTNKNTPWNLEIYDAVIIHFSLRTTINGYIPKFIRDNIASFRGPKILFVQDEYDYVKMTWENIKEMGITDVFTCVPSAGLNYVYSKEILPGLNFVSTLTGYIPEDDSFAREIVPLAKRHIAIGYRGRRLPHHYGLLGHEKLYIGERMKAECEARGIAVDVETDDSKRIYVGWHRFLGSCRATLGTESGCNIFDFDDSLRIKAQKLADRPFEEVYEEHFKEHEAPFRMNQISPKFFEAIMLKTALICFRGEYSGILKPDLHYIPLEKDFSNIDEVLQKLFDDNFIEQMTERAYRDIVASGRYTYRRFVEEFDGWLDQRLPTGGTEIIMAPVAVRRGNRVSAVRHLDSRDFVITSIPLGGNNQREAFRAKFWVEGQSDNWFVYRSQIERIATRIGLLVPRPVRPAAKRVYWVLVAAVRRFRKRKG